MEKDIETSADSAGQESNTRLKRQLQKANISVYQGEKDSKSKNELKRIIGKIRSIVFKSQNQPPKPVIDVEPLTTVEPDEASAGKETQKEYAKPQKAVKSKLRYEPVSDQTLQMLEDFLQEPNRADNPFELGEILFFSGHLKEAVVFYQEALNRSEPNDLGSAQEKAWILFQIGNCLRNDDMPTASKAYRQLITEYADSPWAEPAKAQEKLIDWYLKDKPRTLIVERERLANGQ